jgi:hypothetical protein
MKCNVCDQVEGLTPHPHMPGAMLCDRHMPKLTPPPATHRANAVVVDRDELFGLKAEGLVSLRTYVYLALRIEGVGSNLKCLDLTAFAFRWNLQREDCIAAIAQLAKKGIVSMDVKQLMTAAYTHVERVQAMERSANG